MFRTETKNKLVLHINLGFQCKVAGAACKAKKTTTKTSHASCRRFGTVFMLVFVSRVGCLIVAVVEEAESLSWSRAGLNVPPLPHTKKKKNTFTATVSTQKGTRSYPLQCTGFLLWLNESIFYIKNNNNNNNNWLICLCLIHLIHKPRLRHF